MTTRGEATRARLLEATRVVVREVGYPHASTRAIAHEAGVAEGTIYRHFPEKASLFVAAVLDANAPLVAWVASLPGRAGQATVEDNLVETVERLAALRNDVVPLELAIAADPELAAQHRRVVAGAGGNLPDGPPKAIAAYLTAEQRLGRVRSDLDPTEAAIVLLAALFGLATAPPIEAGSAGPDRLAGAVRLLVRGIAVDDADAAP
jgi:AcrR family transcriptional regulator